MPAVGLTGGVATGKSTFLKALLRFLPSANHFDADRCVHELLTGDAELQREIGQAFGPAAMNADGTPNRRALRDAIYEDEQARLRLEALVHPRVREQWVPMARQARNVQEVTVFDIPLLYETAAEGELDRVAVVACSANVQRNRLLVNRSLAPELIERMIKAQLDLTAKIHRADHVVWNDGSAQVLDQQARMFADYLREIYG